MIHRLGATGLENISVFVLLLKPNLKLLRVWLFIGEVIQNSESRFQWEYFLSN